MKSFPGVAIVALMMLLGGMSPAQVLVKDSGVQTRTIGPGAPAHVIGLTSHSQTIAMDTGAQTYALRYSVARDPNHPQKAIPGEGYIGMPQPADCNWYAGGFFDLQLNGRSLGSTMIHSLTGRRSGDRGIADFIFDDPLAVARVRFVVQAGGDCLYAQILLEPKAEITSLRLVTLCFPAAYVTEANNAARHVRTATRDFAQGDSAVLDITNEWWTLYYDTVYNLGYVAPTGHSGVGPCAMLWLPEQTEKAGFTVGSYGTSTALELKPGRRDYRVVFIDYAGRKNAAAQADLQGRAQALEQELAAFSFADPAIANWPLVEKQAEIRRALLAVPEEKEASAQYERWAQELRPQLDLVRSGTGKIMPEANAARLIGDWERGLLPELMLKALLNEI